MCQYINNRLNPGKNIPPIYNFTCLQNCNTLFWHSISQAAKLSNFTAIEKAKKWFRKLRILFAFVIIIKITPGVLPLKLRNIAHVRASQERSRCSQSVMPMIIFKVSLNEMRATLRRIGSSSQVVSVSGVKNKASYLQSHRWDCKTNATSVLKDSLHFYNIPSLPVMLILRRILNS